ncbi:MAG TPA: hypothetical protein VIX90_07590 [Edaphobacter sp.]
MITLNPVDHTYRLSTPQGGKFHPLSVQQLSQLLKGNQDAFAQGVERPPFRMTSLGVKQENGMTLYGQRVELNTASKEVREIWRSDLGVKVSEKYTWPLDERDRTGTTSDVRREEPDPNLFKIPEGYTQIQSVPRDLEGLK